MSGPSGLAGLPITSRRQLVEYHEAGNKPPAAWRVGTEHEKFVFRRADLRRVPYEGPSGIGALLQGMTRFGWEPVLEKGNIIALSNDARCSITLEPGGQFELSGAPLETLHQTCEEVHEHLRQVREVCDELGLGMIGLGFDPKSRREEVPWMPKGRYRIMRDYMPKKGGHGLDMMLRTCTVQMRPVTMTCVAACVGLLPAALSSGIGSQVQRPLALVVVGGIVLAPIRILIVLPVAIDLFSRHAAPQLLLAEPEPAE